jgi:hypothetical protein
MTESIHIKKFSGIPPGRRIFPLKPVETLVENTHAVMAAIAGTLALAAPALARSGAEPDPIQDRT